METPNGVILCEAEPDQAKNPMLAQNAGDGIKYTDVGMDKAGWKGGRPYGRLCPASMGVADAAGAAAALDQAPLPI